MYTNVKPLYDANTTYLPLASPRAEDPHSSYIVWLSGEKKKKNKKADLFFDMFPERSMFWEIYSFCRKLAIILWQLAEGTDRTDRQSRLQQFFTTVHGVHTVTKDMPCCPYTIVTDVRIPCPQGLPKRFASFFFPGGLFPPRVRRRKQSPSASFKFLLRTSF